MAADWVTPHSKTSQGLTWKVIQWCGEAGKHPEMRSEWAINERPQETAASTRFLMRLRRLHFLEVVIRQ